jgi:hypothetical protein
VLQSDGDRWRPNRLDLRLATDVGSVTTESEESSIRNSWVAQAGRTAHGRETLQP